MKAVVFGLGALLAMGSQAAAAVPCNEVRIEGEVQLVPIDGSGDVLGGRIRWVEDALGVRVNPVKAEPASDGSIALNVYEANVPVTHGQLVGSVGWIRLVEGTRRINRLLPSCSVQIKVGRGAARTFEIAMQSRDGHLILEQDGEPTMLLQLVQAR